MCHGCLHNGLVHFVHIRDLYIQGRERLRVRVFHLKFFRVFSKYRLPGKLPAFYHFSPEKLAPFWLFSLLKEVTRSPDRKVVKLLTFDIPLFPPL